MPIRILTSFAFIISAVCSVTFGQAAGDVAPADPGKEPVMAPAAQQQKDPARAHEARMAWWREARFGMFIHWGLYAIPAGQWQGETEHAEWIRYTAGIPIEQYDRFVEQFNPVRFDADAWVRMAKDAGMKYIVITSKHHDGFALFDSQVSDFDVRATPFRRDILKELADACAKEGIRLCFYHSIMDWHHPDYTPRRPFEAQTRPADDADLDRYVAYMKAQLRELVTGYGPIGVLWFDGEWEHTWTHERGVDLYDYVRSLQPDIIINNRVDKGREGMAGLTRAGGFVGDFGTPEQEIPATGLAGVDWETCMTMNDHWGFNRNDHNWKSTQDLIRKLVDIASKGGNFLLNVGPTAEGEFPPESVQRLREIGAWMRVNGESIYGTHASPFRELPWGRCTLKPSADGADEHVLYLHVFDWPADGQLVVPGVQNEPVGARLLSSDSAALQARRQEDAIIIRLAQTAPDPVDSVVALTVRGTPSVVAPPTVSAELSMFVDSLEVRFQPPAAGLEVRYTLDGSTPTANSPVAEGPLRLTQTARVAARAFQDGRPVSGTSSQSFERVEPQPGLQHVATQPGLAFSLYEGEWSQLPEFDRLTPMRTGTLPNFRFPHQGNRERFGYRFVGFVRIEKAGIYRFFVRSDDGSRLYIGERLLADNDGLHAPAEQSGTVALGPGLHAIRVEMFERTGGDDLAVFYAGPDIEKQPIPDELLSHAAAPAADGQP